MFRVRFIVLIFAAVILAACSLTPVTQAPRDAATAVPTDRPVATATLVPTTRPTGTATPVPVDTPAPVPTGEPEAAQAVRMLLRLWLGEAGGNARLVSLRATEWPDSCFGAGYPHEGCALVSTPGYEMTFEVEGESYTFRTDRMAERYRLTAAPPAEIGETIVSWTGGNVPEAGSCAVAEIGTKAVAFGECSGQMMTGRFANESNRKLLDEHVARFASFQASTPAGQIEFTGKGDQEATAADQRAVAELASLMLFEARSGRAGASWATVIHLQQETAPGRTPMCVSVEMTGLVYVSQCAADAPVAPLFLNPGGLEQLYRWVDEVALFDAKFTDKELVTEITFGGRGAREATDADKQAIRTFAEGLIGEARDQRPQLVAGNVRIALPLLLPDGLDWNPAEAEAADRRFRARAVDPDSEVRWVEVRGALDALAPPAGAASTPVALRSVSGSAYNFGQGHVVMWQEGGTFFAVSASFSLTETVEIAGSLSALTLELFEQIMRERTPAGSKTRLDATFKDTTAGFQLNYPSGWTLQDASAQARQSGRGYYATLMSWPQQTPYAGELPENGTMVQVQVSLWEPVDLDQYVAHRKQAWADSAVQILEEERWTLAGNTPAVRLLLKSDRGTHFILLTLIHERFVTISGEGDSALAGEIARTLQPTNTP